MREECGERSDPKSGLRRSPMGRFHEPFTNFFSDDYIAWYPPWQRELPMNNSGQSVSLGDTSLIWTRWFARSIAPRKHFRVLPTRTRPSLFGGD